MCYGYIYIITDTTNGMKYIGQHKHKNFMLDNSYHGSGTIIQNIQKTRSDTLKMEYLMGVDSIEEANFFENYWIEKLNTIKPNGYNLNSGGGVNIPSEETRKKISESNKGKCCGENNYMFGKGYLVAGEKNGMYGKHHTEETKERLREAFSGENNPQFGKKGELATCYGRTGEKHPMFGKHHDEEMKKQISESVKITKNKPQNQKVCRCLLYIYREMFKDTHKEIDSKLTKLGIKMERTSVLRFCHKYNIKQTK